MRLKEEPDKQTETRTRILKVYILHDSYAEYYEPIIGVFTSEQKAIEYCKSKYDKAKDARYGHPGYWGHYVNNKFETWFDIDGEELDPE